MEVWIAEWLCSADSNVKVSVFHNKDDAYKLAITEILSVINNEWDLDDEGAASDLEKIVELSRNGFYKSAISIFHDGQSDEDPQYWSIYSKEAVGKYMLNVPKDSLATAPAIDNYVCPSCGNTKCNQNEKSCWRCEFPF